MGFNILGDLLQAVLEDIVARDIGLELGDFVFPVLPLFVNISLYQSSRNFGSEIGS